jgi:hypothetical protein
MMMKEKDNKKTYEKPKVTRIKLDARTAILGICKTSGAGGPGYFNCDNLGAPCESAGS